MNTAPTNVPTPRRDRNVIASGGRDKRKSRVGPRNRDETQAGRYGCDNLWSTEYLPAPVTYNSSRPPIMLTFL
jgi:hypothetical protein